MSKPKNTVLIGTPSIKSTRDAIDEVNEVLLKKKAEAKVKAENEAFDHFVATGEVVPVKEDPYNLIYHGHLPSLGKTASVIYAGQILKNKGKNNE